MENRVCIVCLKRKLCIDSLSVMDVRDVASDVIAWTVQTTRKSSNVTGGVETQAQKQVIKLTAKALADKLDRLRNGRKAKMQTKQAA